MAPSARAPARWRSEGSRSWGAILLPRGHDRGEQRLLLDLLLRARPGRVLHLDEDLGPRRFVKDLLEGKLPEPAGHRVDGRTTWPSMRTAGGRGAARQHDILSAFYDVRARRLQVATRSSSTAMRNRKNYPLNTGCCRETVEVPRGSSTASWSSRSCGRRGLQCRDTLDLADRRRAQDPVKMSSSLPWGDLGAPDRDVHRAGCGSSVMVAIREADLSRLPATSIRSGPPG